MEKSRVKNQVTEPFLKCLDFSLLKSLFTVENQQALKLMSNPLTECVRAPTEI